MPILCNSPEPRTGIGMASTAMFSFTDGAKYVADEGGAYWLLDTISICQRHEPHVAAEAFQVWTLTVRPDRTATLTCDDGNGKVVYTEEIEFTDFPRGEITL